jgi:TPR repeat protein
MGDHTLYWQRESTTMGNSMKSANFLIESRINDAASGNARALFDLGVAYSTGSGGVDVNLVEAHKWFNLAALNGHEEAPYCRAEISDEMTAREIADAQRHARAWLQMTERRAA